MTLKRSQSQSAPVAENITAENLVYPKLRNGIEPYLASDDKGELFVGLQDQLELSPQCIFISQDLFYLLQFFDGKNSVLEIRTCYMKKYGKFLFENRLQELVETLDNSFLLDNQRTDNRIRELQDEYRELPYREAVCAGNSYPAEVEGLAVFLEQLMHNISPHYTNAVKNSQIKAIVAPHIDLRLGGNTFAHAYYQLLNSPHIDLFVILGIGHFGIQNLFSLTQKNFQTPDGLVYTDTQLVNDIMRLSQYDFMAEELIHRDEHSIELQTVFLNHYFRDFKILPILCSFQHQVFDDQEQVKIFTDFIHSVKTALSDYNGTICYIASVDLAHVGVKYGDPAPPDKVYLAHVEQQDREILNALAATNRTELQQIFKRTNDPYHICGYSALTTLLELLPQAQGKLLDYHSAVMDDQNSTVTFASMLFV